MPNLKGAKKRMRSSLRKREQNKGVSSKVKTLRREAMETLESGTDEKRNEVYRAYCSALDRAAKKGVIKKNTASRRKRRMAERIRRVGA